ncbi:hypothetical protein [Streptomyces sp. NRRL S-37]|uniref:hypothetical protein n=1 Tax=Streptomyces sp. NRRL S-37 TaxID=1463903 RepID=UPI0004CAE162|nr:hypothetical protein [Streptomyces sp. NRRL S-37]
MAVQDIRTAARLIGRRNTLRYLAIGAASALVAACTGESGKPAPSGSTKTGPTGPTATPVPPAPGPSEPSGKASPTAPSATTAGVMGRAFDAFVKGDWTVESTTPGNETVKGTATVRADGGGNGGFTIVWAGEGAPVTWSGGWLLRGGHLRIDVYDAPQDMDRLTGGEALTVPEEVGEGAFLLLPWQPPGHDGTGDGQRLKVTYKNDVLRIVHTERSGSESVHVCTRAA